MFENKTVKLKMNNTQKLLIKLGFVKTSMTPFMIQISVSL